MHRELELVKRNAYMDSYVYRCKSCRNIYVTVLMDFDDKHAIERHRRDIT